MKKIVFLIFSVFFSFSIIMGQNCISQNETITLSSQNEIDSFSINYPNCDIIDGNLTVGGDGITNLLGLSSITRIGELFRIHNTSLENLEGLTNLTFTGGFYIFGNDLLKISVGLENLKTVNGNFILQNNKSIKNLVGLESITRISSAFNISDNDSLENLNGLGDDLSFEYTSFTISNNRLLTDLKGLESLTEIYGMRVEENESLQSLAGLDNVTSIALDLSVLDNDLLSSLDGLSSLTYIGSTLRIYDNDLLENLNGLESVTFIHDSNNTSGHAMEIQNNEMLKNLEGLNNVTHFGSSFIIKNNNQLENLAGLENLSAIDGFSYIENNSSLKNLKGLNNTTTIQSLRIIGNASLQNFEGLQNLTAITSLFKVEGNDSLLDFEGLNNLKSLGSYFEVIDNDALLNFQGLNNLTSINNYFEVIDNFELQNFQGLDNLTSINNYIEISGNTSLVRMTGLENLSFVESTCKINGNNSLIDITQLAKLFQYFQNNYNDNPDFKTLTISSNQNLSKCAVFSLCTFLRFSPAGATINNNGDNCSSISQILDNCEELKGKINISIFNDNNENGIYDEEENLVSGISIKAEPLGINIFPNSSIGADLYFLEDGDYSFIYDQALLTDRWELTTDSIYQVSIDPDNKFDEILFGVKSIPFSENIPVTTSSPARCNEMVPFFTSTSNTGNTITTGTLWVMLDEFITDYSFESDNQPDTIFENQIGWFFENLNPGEQFKKEIELLIPGPPSFELGNKLSFETVVQFQDENGLHTENSQYSTLVLCSWDPNDKLVQPEREGNFTLFEEDLIYTIRFQNTGNAEAIHVSVKDTLDSNLDIRTFKILDTSHPDNLTTTFENGRFASFNFDFIYLPDSTSNIKGSQGYVTYTIKSASGLDENTPIKNTASIFFDFNPPIVTNTTLNTMVSCLPIEEQVIAATLGEGEVYELPDGSVVDQAGVYNVVIENEEGCPIEMYIVTLDFLSSNSNLPLQGAIGIAPNPNVGVFTLDLDVDGVLNYRAVISDPLGKEMKTIQIIDKQTLVHTNSFSAGVYFLQILDEDDVLQGVKKFVLSR